MFLLYRQGCLPFFFALPAQTLSRTAVVLSLVLTLSSSEEDLCQLQILDESIARIWQPVHKQPVEWEMTSLVRIWKIRYSSPGCSFA